MSRRQRTGAALFGICTLCAGGSGAQEVAPFRLLGIDGSASVRFLRDDFGTGLPAAAGAPASRMRQTLTDLRTEVFVMTHSYVYHPNFLLLDVGGGPVLQQGRFATEAGETRSGGTLYNFLGRATLLRDKPYRGSLFFEHLNPTLSLGLGQVMSQESRRLGFDVALLEPFTPVPVLLDASRSEFRGRGTDRIIDDRIDRVTVRASRSFGALGMTQLHYQAAEQDSRSGSPNLPIQGSTSSTRSASLDTRLQFGANRNIHLVNLVSWNAQAYRLESGAVPDRRDARFLLDLVAAHSAATQSFATLESSSSDQGALTSTRRTGTAGVRFAPTAQLSGSLSARSESNRTTEFDSGTWGTEGSARFERRLPVGTLQASYAARYERVDQQSRVPQTTVVGERMALSGTALVPLARPRVIAGSVTLSNEPRTQTFVEGLDYVLSVVGVETRVQRLIGGNITDGQTVLVDYACDVGGTYAFSQFHQTVNLSWNATRATSVYFRAVGASPRLESGIPTFQLNEVRGRTVGARTDLPLGFGHEALVGGSIEHESRRETVSPYRRSSADLYAQIEDPFVGIGSIRVTGRRSKVLYDHPGNDVDLRGIDVRYATRHPLGIELSGDVGLERDKGGATPRSRTFAAMRAQWRYRQATLSAELTQVKEQQGAINRTRSAAQLTFRRDF